MRTVFSVSLIQLIIFISSQLWKFSASVEYDLYERNMKKSFQELQAVKNIKEPYMKFYKTFAKLTVCSLRKSQKSKLCGELIKHKDTSWMVLNNDKYEDYKCSRIEFIWPVPPTDDVSVDKISAAPCPPFLTAKNRPYDAQGPSTLLYFVASSTELRKVFFFARYDIDEPIMSAGIAHEIDIVCILRDENIICGDKSEDKVDDNKANNQAEDNEAKYNKVEDSKNEDKAEGNKAEGIKAEDMSEDSKAKQNEAEGIKSENKAENKAAKVRRSKL